jgi:tryptophan 2,3-dioxygenase
MNGEHPANQQLTYGDYLRIPELLALQRPLASPPAHDELLFIIIHQTYELWFKLLLHELDGVTANLRAAACVPASREEVYEAARLLRRCTEIARLLVEQFTVLETMLPTHFLAFRDRLRPASGFQSEQFREIEFLCGLKDEALLSLHEPSPEMHAALTRRLKEPSLREVFSDALAALGIIPHMPGASEAEHSQAKARAIVTLYRSESSHRDWIDVCERLSEFDELMVAWRLRHIQMVERTIGMKGGTGGTSGVSYLRSTLDKKFFPELWEARSLMSEGPR